MSIPEGLKIGILGCGKQARKHLASLKKIPGVQLVVADVHPELAQELAKESGTSAAKSPEEILEDPEIKALLICTPTPTHLELIEAALRAGKDVFCEKPLCGEEEDPFPILDLAQKTERLVMIGYVYRFVPAFEKLKNLLDEEESPLGRPLVAFFRLGGRGGHQKWKHFRASGGGAINEMLVHMLDLALWYFGPLEKVEVLACELRLPERDIQGERVKVDAEDFVVVRCRGKDGVEIYCEADLITPAFSQYIEIQGENGSFLGSIQKEMPSYLFLREARSGWPEGKTFWEKKEVNLWDRQMQAFIKAIQERSLDRNTLKDSIALHEIMREIKKQAEELQKNDSNR